MRRSRFSLQQLGHKALSQLGNLGKLGCFLPTILLAKNKTWLGIKLCWQQVYYVGVLSLPVILLSSLFIGMVLGLQGHLTLVRFGAEQALGQLVALSLVRELAPVVCALLFAGRAGSAITAEIALLKTTEQLSALDLMGIDPVKRIVAPRFWAAVWSMPILTLIFMAVAIIGGGMIAVNWLRVDAGSFWGNMRSAVDWHQDILNGLIKSFVFGLLVASISVFQGYFAKPSAEGIARATTRSVVFASMSILVADFVLTAFMFRM